MFTNHSMRRSVLIVAIYLATAVVLHELRLRHVVTADTVTRLLGMLMGLMVLSSANAIPKSLLLLAQPPNAPARAQTLRRLATAALVLGSLGYTLAYALAPIAIASTLAICLLAPGIVVVSGITAYFAWKRHSAN